MKKKQMAVGEEVFYDKNRFHNNIVKPMSTKDKENFQKKLQEEYGIIVDDESEI